MLPLQLISWGETELLWNLNSAPKSLLVAIKRETLIWHNLRACSSDGQPGLHKYKSIFPGKNSFWSLKVFLKGRFFRNELYYFHCVWPLPREGRASYDSCIGCLVKRGRCTIICLHYAVYAPSYASTMQCMYHHMPPLCSVCAIICLHYHTAHPLSASSIICQTSCMCRAPNRVAKSDLNCTEQYFVTKN